MSLDPHASYLTPELIALAEQIGATLRWKYCGKSNAVTANKIAEGYAKLGIRISRHELCPMVNYLRSNGALIGSGKHGYYLCETPEEVSEVIDNLRGRIMGIERAIKGMEQA